MEAKRRSTSSQDSKVEIQCPSSGLLKNRGPPFPKNGKCEKGHWRLRDLDRADQLSKPNSQTRILEGPF